MDALNESIAIAALITGVVLVVFIIARYTYQIKKAMIDKGNIPESSESKLKYLDIGCIVVGIGIGLLFSSIFTTMRISEDTMDLLVWGTISVFGGIGLIVAHFIRRKLEN